MCKVYRQLIWLAYMYTDVALGPIFLGYALLMLSVFLVMICSDVPWSWTQMESGA